jgi:hypothetical protein
MNLVIGTRCDTPCRSEAEQRAFFESVMTGALSADARGRTGEYFISIAGSVIHLIFASAQLQHGMRSALSPLRVEPSASPEAVLYVWDSESTGVAITPAPCSRDCFTDRGDIWGFDSPRFRSAFHWGDHSLNLLDTETGTGTFWVRDAEDLPYWSKAAPLRTLFHWLMTRRGCRLLHAAAVGTADGGVLIVGRGGVGKSTTALACLAAGMKYVADDYLVVQLDPEPRAFRLYGTAKLEASQLRQFPELQNLVTNPDFAENEKVVLDLLQSSSYRVAKSLPLAAALTPRFAPVSATEIRPAEPSRVLHSAAFTTMTQLPHSGRATHEFIERLTDSLPCYEVVLGSNIREIPAALAAFLSRPSGPVVSTAAKIKPYEIVDRPFLSVVIPVYNGAHFLPQAVESILAQDYSPLEIIVVDDGSTDDLKSVVSRLNLDLRFLSQHNQGPGPARNLGIRNSSGELLAFLDVDDQWPNDMLRTLSARLIDQPDLDVVHGYGQLIRSSSIDGSQEFIGSARESFPYFISAALYRRRAFQEIGLFDPELRFSEDSDWFTRARESGLRTERLEQVTLRIRRHEGNMTKNKNLRELGALRLFKKALDRRRSSGAREL